MSALTKPHLQEQNALSLGGNISYSIQADRIQIDIGSIANNREPGLLSGTLSIELWALPFAYQGNEFSGYSLAATTIGELTSQYFISNCRYDLNFQEPPQGNWTLTLMLREWDGQGYVTRDYVNFAIPYVKQDLGTQTKPSGKVVHLAYSSESSAKPAAQVLHSAEFQEGLEKTTSQQRVEAPKSKTKVGTTNKHSKVVKTTQKKPAVQPEKLSKEEITALRKLNKLKAGDFLSIKGIVPKLAEDLHAAQPYSKLSDLMNVKGVGKQKFEAIQAGLLSK